MHVCRRYVSEHVPIRIRVPFQNIPGVTYDIGLQSDNISIW